MKLAKVEKVDEEFLKEVVRRITLVVDFIKIILFGSYAYGKPKKGGDLDIMVVVKDDVKSCRKVASEVYGALCGLLIPKDVVVVRLKRYRGLEKCPTSFYNQSGKQREGFV